MNSRGIAVGELARLLPEQGYEDAGAAALEKRVSTHPVTEPVLRATYAEGGNRAIENQLDELLQTLRSEDGENFVTASVSVADAHYIVFLAPSHERLISVVTVDRSTEPGR